MNRDIVKLSVVLAALVCVSGCATSGASDTQARNSMISAAEFEAMITIEVHEPEPLPVEDAVAAAY